MYGIPAICARAFELNRSSPVCIVVHTPYVAFNAIPRTHSVYICKKVVHRGVPI